MMAGFYDDDWRLLFDSWVDEIPRPGDIVYYSMQAVDRAEWNPIELNSRDAINGREYIVETVTHQFRKTRVRDNESHRIFIVVKVV